MAGENILDYTVRISGAADFGGLINELKRAYEEIGSMGGRAARGGFEQISQAAEQRASQLTGTPGQTQEFARLMGELRTAISELARSGLRREGGQGAVDLGAIKKQAQAQADDIKRQESAAKLAEARAADPDTATRYARAAQGRMRLGADVEEKLVSDPAYQQYRDSLVRLTRAQQLGAAQLQEALIGTDYEESSKRLAVAQRTLAANLQENLVGSEYEESSKRLTIAQRTLAANLQEKLIGTEYEGASKRLTVAQRELAARLQQSLIGSGYEDASKRLTIAQQTLAANLQESLVGNAEYEGASRRLAVARQRQAANLQAILAGDNEYLGATTRAATARAQISAQVQAGVQQTLAGDNEYLGATKRIAVARAEQAAKVQESLAGDTNYAQYTARVTAARAEQQAKVQAALAGDTEYAGSMARTAAARAEQQAKTQTMLAGDEEYVGATARAAAARAEQQAKIQQALAGDDAYTAASVRAAAYREEQASKLRAGLAADDTYIQATARTAMAREEQAARVSIARVDPAANLEDLSRTQILAKGAVAKRMEADLLAAETAREMAANERGSIEAAAQKRLAETQLTTIIREREREEMRALVKTGQAGGTRFQQVQALASRSGRAPQEFPTIGQAFTQKTITSAGYMLGGMLSASLLFGVIEATKEASKLQEQFAGLRGQMAALGQSDSFGTVREQIKGISNETGIAASEVTKFAARLIGVFNDPVRAIDETAAAMKLAVVSGTDLATMLEELVPVAEQFGTSITHIGDLAVYIHDKFGIAEEATLHFLGEVAPLAEEAGLSLEDMGVIGATAANAIGKSINVAAEQFNKVLPTMQANQDKIFQIFRGSPEAAKLVDPIVDAFGRGESGQAFKLILQGYNSLNRVQQENLIRVSGSRREWALLYGLFSNAPKLLHDMSEAEANAGRNTGGLERRFQEVSATLSRSIERIQETFKNVVEGLLSSGIGDALALIGKGVETAVGLVNLLVGAFNTLNEATKLPGFDNGVLAPMVQFAAAVFMANKAMSLFSGLRSTNVAGSVALTRGETGLSLAIGRRAVATQEGLTSLEADTVAKQANAAVTGEVAGLESTLAATKFRGTGTGLILPAKRGQLGANIVKAGEESAVTQAVGTGIGGMIARGISNSPLLTRLFSGGRLFQGTQAMQAANASAAAAGMTSGVGAMWGIGLPLIAGMQVKGARDEQAENLEKQSNDLRQQFQKLSDERIGKISKDFNEWGDRVQELIFQVDLPGSIAKQEATKRYGRKGATAIGIMMDRGTTGNFVKSMSDARLKQIEDYLNASDEGRNYAAQLGFDIDKGVVDRLANVAQRFTGMPMPTDIGKGRVVANRETLKKILPEIKRRAEAGEEGAAQLANYIEAEIQSNRSMSEIRDAVDEALKKGDINAAIQEAGGIQQFLQIRGLYDPEGQLETGQITKAEYIAIINQRVADLQRQLRGAPDQEKAQKEFDAALKKARDFQAQLNQERVDEIKRIAPMQSLRPKEDIFQAELAGLPSLDITHQVEKIPDLIQEQWDSFQESVAQAQTPEEALSRAQAGIKVPRDVQVLELIRNMQRDAKLMDLLQRAASGEDIQAFMKSVAEEHIDTGKSIRDILLERVKRKSEASGIDIAYTSFQRAAQDWSAESEAAVSNITTEVKPPEEVLQATYAQQAATVREAAIGLQAARSGTSPYVAAKAELDSANVELEKYLRLQQLNQGGPTIQADIDNARARVAKAIQAIKEVEDSTAQAMEQWAVVEANGDPIRETAARLDSAINDVQRISENNRGDERDPALIKARQTVRQLQLQQVDNMNAIVRSSMELQAFDRNRDPVQAARDAIALAQFNVNTAKGEDARNQALLQLKQAQRSLDDALEQNLRSIADLDITNLNIAQKPVEAAQRAVQEAERQLAYARANNLGEAAINQAIANLNQKRSDAIDAGVNEQEDLINFMLEMGQITTQEAAARLQVEAAKYAVGTKKWRDIQLRIHQLTQQAQQDLQFNLPSELALPTLYEARRTNQSYGMGIGYQDNRKMNVTIQVIGTQDPNATANQVMAALASATNSAPVYGGVVGV